MKALKKLIMWGCVAGVVYFFLSTHIIFLGSNVKLLKKTSLSMDYIIFSTHGKSNQAILAIDTLREAGIGQVLVGVGRMSEEELERLTEKIEEERQAGK